MGKRGLAPFPLFLVEVVPWLLCMNRGERTAMPTPDFIVDLRKKIGHDPLWLVGVTAYIEDAEGRVLLEQRTDTGRWALVSGINEPGEEPADTVVREALEETGVHVVPTDLVSVKADDRLITYKNGDQVRYLDILFACRLADEADGAQQAHVNDEESLAVGWFSLDSLPSPLTASTAERIKRVQVWRQQAQAGNPRALFSISATL